MKTQTIPIMKLAVQVSIPIPVSQINDNTVQVHSLLANQSKLAVHCDNKLNFKSN